MQVSTGRVFDSRDLALQAGVPAHDLVEVIATREQVDALSAAVRRGQADVAKKKARRAQQASRRRNR